MSYRVVLFRCLLFVHYFLITLMVLMDSGRQQQQSQHDTPCMALVCLKLWCVLLTLTSLTDVQTDLGKL